MSIEANFIENAIIQKEALTKLLQSHNVVYQFDEDGNLRWAFNTPSDANVKAPIVYMEGSVTSKDGVERPFSIQTEVEGN